MVVEHELRGWETVGKLGVKFPRLVPGETTLGESETDQDVLPILEKEVFPHWDGLGLPSSIAPSA